MKPDARAINGEYGRGRRSLARARGRSPDRLKPLRDLYEGQSVRAHRFRYGLLAFDLVTVAFIVVTSFLPRGPVVETLDVGFGLFILADFVARLTLCRHRMREFPSSRSLPRWSERARASCAFCARYDCSTPMNCSNGFARTARSSSATKK
jgi:hypothetical protein